MKIKYLGLAMFALLFVSCSSIKEIENKVEDLRGFCGEEDYINAKSIYESNTEEKFRKLADKVIEQDIVLKSKYLNKENYEEIESDIKLINAFYNSDKLEVIKKEIQELKDEIKESEEVKKLEKEVEELKQKNEEAEKKVQTNKNNQATSPNKMSNNSTTYQSPYGEFTYKRYTDSKFGYTMVYPSFLTKSASFIEDGISFSGFITADENAGVFGIAGNNYEGITNDELYNQLLSNSPNISYKYLGNKSLAITYEEGGYIYYQYMVVDSGVINGFMLQYPAEQAVFFDTVVNTVYDSFKSGDLRTYH